MNLILKTESTFGRLVHLFVEIYLRFKTHMPDEVIAYLINQAAMIPAEEH